MKMSSKNNRWLGFVRTGLVFSFLAVCASWLALSGGQPTEVTPVAGNGWGSESLASLQDGLNKVSPIGLANACGMGASSCFKCHDGRRAKAATMDPAKAPWHVQHSKVNGSCVGCHKGNPRLMKEDLAHAGMLKGPRSGADTCGTCHKADQAKVEAVYKSVTSGSK